MTHPRPARRHSRRSVELEAAVHRGTDLLVGSLLDLSPGGAFFRPEAGVIEGAFMQLDPRSPPLRVNDELELDIRHRSGLIVTIARVRWVGRSDLHGTAGVGLQFPEELRSTVLLPKLD